MRVLAGLRSGGRDRASLDAEPRRRSRASLALRLARRGQRCAAGSAGLLPLSLLLLRRRSPSLNRRAAAPLSEGFAIRRDALAAARAAYATRRVRHALEDHRLRARDAIRASSTRAARAARAARWRRRAAALTIMLRASDGAVLLAPER